MLSYDQAVAKILENSSLSEDEISSRINEKLNQFAGLVSKQGAAHILANELGIKLISNAVSRFKIANVVVGMSNAEILTKVLAVFPARQFNSNGRSGQVGTAILGDDTGTIRGVFWNEQANKLAFIKTGDVLKLKGVYVKENRDKTPELHFNDRSAMVVNPPGESVDAVEYQRQNKTKRLNEISDSDSYVDTAGTVIEVFDIRFFEICGQCGKRARPENDSYACRQHGVVTPDYSYVLNAFLDNGTAQVRTVFFRETAQKFLGKTNEELLAFRDSPEAFEQVKTEALGKFLRISAKVNKNEMYGRIELIANEVSEAKPEEQAAESAPDVSASGTASGNSAEERNNAEENKIGAEKLETTNA